MMKKPVGNEEIENVYFKEKIKKTRDEDNGKPMS